MINSKNKNTKTGVYLNCIDLEIKNQLSFIMEWWHISLEYNNLILWENYVEQNFNFTMLWIQQWQSYPCDLWASLFVLSFFFAQPNFSFLHWLVVWGFWEEEGSYPQQFDLPSFSLQVCSIAYGRIFLLNWLTHLTQYASAEIIVPKVWIFAKHGILENVKIFYSKFCLSFVTFQSLLSF